MAKSTCTITGCDATERRKGDKLCTAHRASMKHCPRCDENKALSEFGRRTSNGREYTRSHCAPCHSWVVRNAIKRRVYPQGKKRCPRCEEVLPIEAFTRSTGAISAYCTPCGSRYRRDRVRELTGAELTEFRARKAASVARNPVTRKAARLRPYNITVRDYERMMNEQGGVCDICKQPETTRRGDVVLDLAVDHDHACCPGSANSCGRCVRALICGQCNKGLGAFRDDTDLMRTAIAYLDKHSKPGAGGFVKSGQPQIPTHTRLVHPRANRP